MGYNDNLTGTWPTNYITQANKVGILDDVAIVASAAAKRADVVVMLDDALDTEIVTYDKDTNEFVMKQNEIAGSKAKTLLDDSFKGSYYEVPKFEKVNQVRDVANQTLNWDIKYIPEGATSPTGDATLIIDKDTKVSHNGGTLFDLEGHQGKVYYVKDGSKYYARFIDVESYTKTVSDKPEINTKDNKVTVNKTTYNKVSDLTANDEAYLNKGSETTKNSNFILYFNDDDQVYLVRSDKQFDEQAYYVKSVGSSSVKLVHGVTTSTKNMKDDDTLIWTGSEFVGPSALKAGDAIMEIASDLYVTVNEITGELTKSDSSKLTIAGKAYVFDNKNFIDDEYNNAGVDVDDVYGNNVKFILDKDNSIAAIMVDETSTGTTLYGIVVDGGKGSNSWAKGFNNITLFTAEGKTVSYDMASDPTYLMVKDDGTVGGTDANIEVKPTVDWLGKLVSYQLNKDGEIKEIKPIGTIAHVDDVTGVVTNGEELKNEISIENNNYLIDHKEDSGKMVKDKSVTLAKNVVIFEVDIDDGDIDPSIVPRASLLAGGDFTPEDLTGLEVAKDAGHTEKASDGKDGIKAYAFYETNSNGAIKVLAYTSASGSNLNYGVVTSWNFGNADNSSNVTLLDGVTYELGAKGLSLTKDGTDLKSENNTYAASNDDVIIYTLSGDKVNVIVSFGEKKGLTKLNSYYEVNGTVQEVDGFNDGLIAFKKDMKPVIFGALDSLMTDVAKAVKPEAYKQTAFKTVMTDSDTVVFVLNGSTGKYEVGSLEDISAGVYAYVPVVDDDGYADLVLVDNYNEYKTTED